jgi:cytochrome c553
MRRLIVNWRLSASLLVAPLIALGQSRPEIPKAWDDQALQSMTIPLAGLKSPIQHAPADWYYRIPERKIYRGYPVYVPPKEPQGYLNWLRAQEPEIAFDVLKLNTPADWILAGSNVFSSPDGFGILTPDDLHDPSVWKRFRFAADYEGSLPGWRYVIRKRGEVEVASTLCGACHERVIEGPTVPGAPGTHLLGAQFAFATRRSLNKAPKRDAAGRQGVARQFSLFSVPWLTPDPADQVSAITVDQVLGAYEAHSTGVVARTGTSLFFPPKVPDLIGVKDRKYLGATGLYRHLGIGDLMRYAALEASNDDYSQYGEFRPSGKLPDPGGLQRLSDAQLYAVALYLYSLKAPANPNKPTTITRRGQQIFDREGCPACHPAPLYTNNKLTPADGFRVPGEHKTKFDVMDESVGTDPSLALHTRKGTGYYTVPSLKNVWYREPTEHNGSLAALEDWFDPVRLQDNYVPTGFKGYGLEAGAVKGHAFALKLSFEERRALTAFLRTL